MGGERRIGDCVELQRGNTYKSARLGEPGPYLLGLASIRPEGGFRDDNLRTYGGETSEKLLLRPGDIYVSLKDVTQSGSLLGSVARVPAAIELGRVTQDTVKLLFKSDAPDKDYIYWLLRTPEYRAYCRERAIGTTNLSLARDDFVNFEVPNYGPEQRCLVGLLNDLDDKIELNRRMARTLEEIARALFRSWFVDFDPVRAKMEGRDLTLPSDIAALFPAQFGDGGLPEGWEPTPLSSLIEIISGGTPRTSEPLYWGGDIPWYSVIDAPPAGAVYVTRTEKSITPEGLSASPARLVDADTTIVSARGTVGKLALAAASMAFNQSCYGIRGAGVLPPRFTFCLMQDAVAGLEARSHGSVFSTITRSTFDAIEYPTFPAPVAKAFETTIDPVFDRLRSVALENETLAALRDTLLPRLISGKLHIPDAEALVEEAA